MLKTLLVPVVGVCLIALSGCDAVCVFNACDGVLQPPQQTVIGLTAVPSDTIAAGDTLTVLATLLDGGDPARFAFHWGTTLDGLQGGTLLPADGRLDGPAIRFVSERSGRSGIIVVRANNGSRDSIPAESTILITVE